MKNNSKPAYLVIGVLTVLFFSSSFSSLGRAPHYTDNKKYIYKVNPASEGITINAEWKKNPWNNIQYEKLNNFMGTKPAHFPETMFKVSYDERNIYVIFQVRDRYTKAVAKEIHGRVWEDSCVEFFFTPGSDINKGYFNLETNCKGVFLLGFKNSLKEDRGLVDVEDCKKITVSHSLQENAESEITKPVTWIIEYSIPVEMLDRYIKVEKPAKGVQWRANFYKCADKTSAPHWLTWAPVINPVPKFHLPEYFGWLEFQ